MQNLGSVAQGQALESPFSEQINKADLQTIGNAAAIDHAWNWFKYHAEQRLVVVRFYLIMIGALGAAYISTLNYQYHFVSTVIAVFGAVISYLFLALDERVSYLIKCGEAALFREQDLLSQRVGYSEIRIIERAAAGARGYFGSYRKVFKAMFVAAILAFGAAAVSSLSQIPSLAMSATWIKSEGAMPKIPDVAIGAIIAALIAGLISLLGLIISKEQKISEFRQSWIDELRADLASLISHANAIVSAAMAGFASGADAWKVVRDDFVSINDAAARIRLRLNPKEQSSLPILEKLSELDNLMAPGKLASHEKIDALEKQLVVDAQVLLKKEWMRVRKGEQVYQIAKWVALVVLVVCVVALGMFVHSFL